MKTTGVASTVRARMRGPGRAKRREQAHRRHPRGIWLLPAFLSLLLAPAAASAATITVNTSADTSASQCTLRNAITAANTDSVSGACSAGSGTDTIDVTATGTINLGSALPDISSDLTIAGPGSSNLDVHRSSVSNFRIFNVANASNTVTISGLTVSNGSLVGNFSTVGGGGGIRNNGTLTLDDVTLSGNSASDSETATAARVAGGALYNTGSGTLDVNASTISGNSISGTTTSGVALDFAFGEGAAIMNSGALDVDQTTIHGNSNTLSAVSNATGGGAISGGGETTVTRSTVDANSTSGTSSAGNVLNFGGGIDMSVLTGGTSHGTLTLDSSTIANNSLSGSAPTPGKAAVNNGGGIYIGTDGGAFITSATISGNRANDAFFHGGNISMNDISGATHAIKNTIVSDPGSNADCSALNGTFTSAGHNLSDAPTEDSSNCNFVNASDQSNTDPQLNPLADNGGPTKTMALANTSPAIDKGTGAGNTTDQRGEPRPRDLVGHTNSDDGSDIGAFELQSTRPDFTSLDFGNQRLGHTGASRIVTLTNELGSSITLGSAGLSGTDPTSFHVDSDTCSSQTLAGGATCQITLSFVTSSGPAGARSAALTVPDDNSSTDLSVGLAGAETNPVASRSPTGLSFGSLLIGTTSASQTVTLSNTGTTPLHISSIALGGPDAGQFAINASDCTTTHGNTLAGSASCTVGVTFAPTTAGAKTATLAMNTDGDNVSASLAGTGTAPPAAGPSPSITPTRKCKKPKKRQASAAKKKCKKRKK
jgi:hypothetical protein